MDQDSGRRARLSEWTRPPAVVWRPGAGCGGNPDRDLNN